MITQHDAALLQDKSSGKRIMGMTPQNSIATMVASKPHALWDVPDNWTLAQSATVPVAYATAYDALVVRGRLQPHHRVLIHSATGAVGLAATRISLNRGCEARPPASLPVIAHAASLLRMQRWLIIPHAVLAL